MEFNNVENEVIMATDGRKFWISRSVAVVGIVCIIKDNMPYFLISQRGKGAADNHGLWCLPCGYLDWSESSYDAFRREVWEETGINIDLLEPNQYIYEKEPFCVITDPSENRQNVSITHVMRCNLEDEQEFPTPNITNHVQDDEVSDVRWVAADELEEYSFAFKHKERLYSFISKQFIFLNSNV